MVASSKPSSLPARISRDLHLTADLAASDPTGAAHLAEALQYRQSVVRAGAQPLRVSEHRPQPGQPFGREQVIQRQGEIAFGRVGKVGVDLDDLHVRDEQQRRVVQRVGVIEQLPVGALQVTVGALVLERKEALLLDVGKAVAAQGLVGARLKGEPLPRGVGLRRRGMPHHTAQVR